jgi:hypothetical protein
MKIYEINKLKRDMKQDNLYNMFQVTYRDFDDPTRPLTPIEVLEEQSMRLDIVSDIIYKEDSFVDILCHVNSIDNPLNIMAGDRILYPAQGFIDSFKTDDVFIEAVPGLLLNAEKTPTVDENRKQYVEANYNLTPTANPVPKEPVRIIGESIVIGDQN